MLRRRALRVLRVRSEPENVPIWVPNLHLAGPWKIRRGLENRGAALAVLVVQGLDILDTEPHPRPRLPLITFRQVDAGPVSGHVSRVFSFRCSCVSINWALSAVGCP